MGNHQHRCASPFALLPGPVARLLDSSIEGAGRPSSSSSTRPVRLPEHARGNRQPLLVDPPEYKLPCPLLDPGPQPPAGLRLKSAALCQRAAWRTLLAAGWHVRKRIASATVSGEHGAAAAGQPGAMARRRSAARRRGQVLAVIELTRLRRWAGCEKDAATGKAGCSPGSRRPHPRRDGWDQGPLLRLEVAQHRFGRVVAEHRPLQAAAPHAPSQRPGIDSDRGEFPRPSASRP